VKTLLIFSEHLMK